ASPVDEVRVHLQRIRGVDFEPAAYAERGYVLRGSIRTDGFRIQTLAFNLNELHSVKYRQLSPDKLPCRLTSTLGGTDYFLTEIRNVVSTKQDIARLWDCEPKSIKILGIDLGQAFVVGASAALPPCKQPSLEHGQDTDDASMTPSQQYTDDAEESGADMVDQPLPRFFNLAVKQKAVYPHSNTVVGWSREKAPREEEESITSIETNIPHRRGPDASIKNYTARVNEVDTDLDTFYGSVVLMKQRRNARKVRAEEYSPIANRFLELVGGSLGAKRKEDNKVVIGVGLGKFSSKIRLSSSLHESFQSCFIQ
ncbi:hypothetical protein BGX30_006373, partial [Mortierella sp. GBA39]